MTKNFRKIILILGDLAILYLSLYITLLIRYGDNYNFSLWQRHFLPFTFIYLIWLVVFYIHNLYEPKFARLNLNFIFILASASIINFLITIVFFYFIPYFDIYPKTILFLNLFFFIIIFILWRLCYYSLMIKIQPSNVLLIGFSKNSLELGKRIIESPFLGYQIKSVIDPEKNQENPWSNVRFDGCLENLEQIVKEEKINTIVVEKRFYALASKKLYQLLPLKIDVFDLPTFWENFIQEIPVSAADEIWFLENLRGQKKYIYEIVKRGIDIIFSFIFLLLSLFFYPFIILFIKLTSCGPIFYQQERVGQNGKIFKIIKFRTMIQEAEKDGPQWTEKNDQRVTSFGRILRKVRLDELPQFLNILKGEMSFIGPRPERPEFVKILTEKIPHFHLRHLIRPGLTGWAQINYPYSSSIEEAEKKLRYDLYYLKNRSLILDLIIFFKTIFHILYFKGR